MFFPVGDSPNLPKTPWVTWVLIAINVAVHLWMWPLATRAANPAHPELAEYRVTLAEERNVLVRQVSAADFARYVYGFKPGAPELSDVFTSMFLHGGLLHLAGNMLFLWIYGDNVEHRLGPWKYLLVYLGTGVAAVLGDAILRSGSEIPSVGASGAISGVLGLYFAWFPRNRVRVWAFLFPFYIGFLELPARFVLGAYLILDNLLPALFASGTGGVAHGAHIGGFLAGWALAASLRGSGREPRLRRGTPGPVDDPLATFRTAVAENRLADAAAILHRLPAGRSPGLATEIELAERAESAGLHETALGVYRRAARIHHDEPGVVRALLGAARVLLHGLGAPTVAYQELAAAAPRISTPHERREWEALVADLRSKTASVPRSLRTPIP